MDERQADELFDEVQARMAGKDAEIEAIAYLAETGETVKNTFLEVEAVIDGLPPGNPADVAARFEDDVLPLLRAGLAAAVAATSTDPGVTDLNAVARRALEQDVAAFEQLVPAYRHQDGNLLAKGRELRESSAVHRREWLTRALALGRSVGLYD
jgi:hypothetical protein